MGVARTAYISKTATAIRRDRGRGRLQQTNFDRDRV